MGAPNQYGIKDGKLAPAFMFDEYLEALKFMNKCYNEGLINQDMATYSSDKWNEQFLSGKAGVIIELLTYSVTLQRTQAQNQEHFLQQVMTDTMYSLRHLLLQKKTLTSFLA